MLKKIKDKIKKLTKHPRFIEFIGYLLYLYSRLVGMTTRWEIHGKKEFYQTWEKDKSIILVIWHGRALMIPHFWNKQRPLNALVSLHNDGRIIAKLLEKYGFGTIGGSSTTGGQSAALALMSSIEQNNAVAIIPDGPVGPRMEMSNSPLYFAKKTGKAIFGATYSIEHSYIAKSWDAMMLPPPFCKGVLYMTKPFYIPADASDEDLAKYRLEIEEELNTLTHKADRQMGIPYIEAGVSKKSKRHKRGN